MQDQFERLARMIGPAAMERLAAARVAVFGLGGVGGYAVEALARSGIGALELVDPDEIGITNLNRQLLATHQTLGQNKAQVAARRVLAIHPACRVTARPVFFLPQTAADFDFSSYDYVIDAIDTVTGKLALIEAARAAGTPIICSLGTGNKLDPSALRVADLYETRVCPLARILRQECRKRGIDRLTVVYSEEPPLPVADGADLTEQPPEGRRAIPGSCAFVPAAAGLLLAARVVRDLIDR